MTPIDTLKNTFTENFDTLKLYLTDIVAASESGFGSQPINSLSNWLVGNILIHRHDVLSHLGVESEAQWSTEEISIYFLQPTDSNDDKRHSYVDLLSNLKYSQASLLNYLGNFDSTESRRIISNKDNNTILNNLATDAQETIESLSAYTILNLLADYESQLTQQFATEQRQNSKTGIY